MHHATRLFFYQPDYMIPKIQRRRHVRMETSARGAFELERLQRLRHLSTVLSRARKGGTECARGAPLKIFTNIERARNGIFFSSGRTRQFVENQQYLDDDFPLYRSQTVLVQDQIGDFKESELDQILLQDDQDDTDTLTKSQFDSSMTSETRLEDISTSDYLPNINTSLPGDSDYNRLDVEDVTSRSSIDEPLSAHEILVRTSPEQINSLLENLTLLHSQYQQSTKKLTSLPESMPPAQTITMNTLIQPSEALVKEAQAEYTMSKTQDQLTMEEGKFWNRVMQSPSAVEDTELVIRDLVQKSSVLLDSFNRRTNLPTLETYDESKEILYAMGVPCIETEGAFEAEALASSLVIHGFADYVASEDTVCF